jgi:hypothetical protein
MKNEMNPTLITVLSNALEKFQDMKSVNTLADGEIISLFLKLLFDLPISEY